jgi:hypothetical protein
MEAEIKNIEFCNTNGYADKVKDVLAKYDVQMSDTELIKIMASGLVEFKVKSTSK